MKNLNTALTYLMKYKRYENKNLLELYKLIDDKGITDDDDNTLSLNDINDMLKFIRKNENKFKIPSSKSCGIVPDANPCGDANEY